MDSNKQHDDDATITNLNSVEFPSLLSHSGSVDIVPSTFSTRRTKKELGLKRPICDEVPETQSEKTSLSLFESTTREDRSPPKKKVIKLNYREPQPNMQSLPSLSFDSDDYFNNNSQNDNSQTSPSDDALNSNLPSLGDFISKVGSTTLNSLKDMDMDFGSSEKSTKNVQNLFTMPPITDLLQKQIDQQVSPGNAGVFSKDSKILPNGQQSNDNARRSTSTAELKRQSANNQFQPQIEGKSSSCSNNQKKYNGSSDSSIGKSCHDKADRMDLSEFSELPEESSGILQNMTACRKNPTHDNFFLMKDLKVSDLPREIQHDDTLTFLTCMFKLVVQITVHSTSSARKGEPDYLHHFSGTNRIRRGSGFITSVDGFVQKFRCKKDNCAENSENLNISTDSGFSFSPLESPNSPMCLRSQVSSELATSPQNTGGRKKHNFYGGLNIHTNRHIIFDKSEADNAFVKFFFDTPESTDVVHGHVASIRGVNSRQDSVILHVMSHDKSLFQKVEMCLENAKSSYNQMLQSTLNMQKIFAPKQSQSWVGVISHPHGLAKHIGLGRVLKEEKDELRVKKYYDAPTCPGSSGGLVITPTLLRLQWPGAVHSLYDNKTGLNVTWDSRVPDLDSTDMSRIHKTVLQSKSKRRTY